MKTPLISNMRYRGEYTIRTEQRISEHSRVVRVHITGVTKRNTLNRTKQRISEHSHVVRVALTGVTKRNTLTRTELKIHENSLNQ